MRYQKGELTMFVIVLFIALCSVNSASPLNFFGHELGAAGDRLDQHIRYKNDATDRLPLQEYHDQALEILGRQNRIRTIQDAELFLMNLMGMGVSERDLFRVLNTIRAGGVTLSFAGQEPVYSPFTAEGAKALHGRYTPDKASLGVVKNLVHFVTHKAAEGYKKLFPAYDRLLRMPTFAHGLLGTLSSGTIVTARKILPDLENKIEMLKKYRRNLHQKLPGLYRLYPKSELRALRKKPLPRHIRILIDEFLRAHDRLEAAKANLRRTYMALFGGSFVLFASLYKHIQRNPAATWGEEFIARQARASDSKVAQSHADSGLEAEHQKVD